MDSIVNILLKEKNPIIEPYSETMISNSRLPNNNRSSNIPYSKILYFARQKMAACLVEAALRRGSTDNITVIIQWIK